MSFIRLLITSVVVEHRTVRDVAVTYGVSESWLYELVARYKAEGEAAFEPRPRRPKTVPNTTPAETVDLIIEYRQKLTAAGLDAGPDTIGWHLEHHHSTVVSRATISRYLAKAGLVVPEPKKRPKSSYTRFAAAMPNETWQSRLHPLPAHPTRRQAGARLRDPDLARRPRPLRPVGDRSPPRHRTDRASHLPRQPLQSTGSPPPRSPTTGWSSPPGTPRARRAPAPATASRPSCAVSTSCRRTAGPTTPPPKARSSGSSRR